MAMLELRNIRVAYRKASQAPVMAVAGVSLEIDRGEALGLVGETGCGKSTLAKATVGLLPLVSGSISFEGRPVTQVGHSRRRRDLRRLQLVFQNPFGSLNPRRTIGSQLLDGYDGGHRLRAAQRRTRVGEILREVGLPADIADRYPHQFSGGGFPLLTLRPKRK